MQTQKIAGQWYEFKVNVFIPEGEPVPTDIAGFFQWMREDPTAYTAYFSDPSLQAL